MLTANTGIMNMYAIPKKLLKKVMPIRNENMELRLMKRIPSSISIAALPLPPRAIGGILSVMMTSAIATKPAPARKNEIAVPSVAIITPATAGATMRVPCHMAALSDTALIIACRSMRCGYSAWRAG